MLGAEFLSFVKGNDPILINTAMTSRELPLGGENWGQIGVALI